MEEGVLDLLTKDLETDYQEDHDAWIEKAKEAGYKIIIPTDYQLILDLDTVEDYQRFSVAYYKMLNNFKVKNKKINFSESGPPGLHIIIELEEPLPVMERILLQAAIGSDPVKEIISLKRIKAGISHPTLLKENPLCL